MDYSNKFGSNFPNEVIPVGTKKDIDDSVKSLISQYYSLIDSNNLDEASTLYNNNKAILEPYIVNSDYFNRLEEEIYNVGIAALNNITTIISDTEPLTQSVNSHWLKEW